MFLTTFTNFGATAKRRKRIFLLFSPLSGELSRKAYGTGYLNLKSATIYKALRSFGAILDSPVLAHTKSNPSVITPSIKLVKGSQTFFQLQTCFVYIYGISWIRYAKVLLLKCIVRVFHRCTSTYKFWHVLWKCSYLFGLFNLPFRLTANIFKWIFIEIASLDDFFQSTIHSRSERSSVTTRPPK